MRQDGTFYKTWIKQKKTKPNKPTRLGFSKSGLCNPDKMRRQLNREKSTTHPHVMYGSARRSMLMVALLSLTKTPLLI